MPPFEKKLKALFQDLNSFLNENKLISRIELRLKIKDLIASYDFSESEMKECEKFYEYPLLQFIFLTVTSGSSLSIQAPFLHEKVAYNQVIFYHSHTFHITEEHLENAYKKVCQLQLKLLNAIATKLLLQVGYQIRKSTLNSIIANRDQITLNCVLFCSIIELIDQIKTLELTSNDAILVPPGSSVKPFIEFYQQHSNQILLAEASVWLIDTEVETVSRFVGLPNDKKLLIYFTRSQLATLIERNWRPKIDSLL